MYDPDENIFNSEGQEFIESHEEPTGLIFDESEDQGAYTATEPLHRRKAADSINPADPETWGRVSRNALCPCGSGKKYKKCCGALK